jgi:tetratricopeptide (TPR) repeat protein
MLSAVKPDSRKNLTWLLTGLFYAALVAGLAALTSHPSLRNETTIVTAMGNAISVKVDEGDAVFWLPPPSPNYRIAGPDPEVTAALNASERTGNALSLHVHLDGARFVEYSDTPEYWIESVEYLGKTYGPYRARIRWSWRGMSAAEAGLLKGLAFDNAWRYDEAVKALDVPLAHDDLGERKLALAYRTRGNAQESLAYPPGHQINDRDDALLMRALNDYRHAAKLDPSDFRAVHWQGLVTTSLGAYDDALALFDEAARRWPDQFFRVAIARGATYRQMGNYDAALRELDRLVEKHGPQRGMMFHYHRGWTLNKLERYAEAVKDFTAGFESQPDFTWAFVGRACSYAQLGDIAHAVEDQRRALELWDQMAKLDATARNDKNRRARLAGTLQDLETALRTAPKTPTSAACVELFDSPTNSHREISRQFLPE